MRKKNSKVTVLMPVYNGGQFLRESLTSVLTQTLSDFELLVIDGGSKDETLDLLGTIRDSRLRVISKPLNLIDSLNLGLDEAKGEYIARMDSDDVAEPRRFAKQLSYLKANPEVVLVGSNAHIIDTHGKMLGNAYMPQASWWVEWCLFFGCAFIHPSVMFSRHLVVQHGLRYGELPIACKSFYTLPSPLESEDYLFWVLASRHGRVCNLASRDIRLRLHTSSKSYINDKKVRADASEISRWNVSEFLGYTVPRTDWFVGESGFCVRSFESQILCLAELYIKNKNLSHHQANVVRQDSILRGWLAAGYSDDILKRSVDVITLLSKTTFILAPNQWRSAIRYSLGDSGYGYLKRLVGGA